MIINKEPYFLKNKNWWEENEDYGIITLTDKAPVKAKLSYQEFYKKMYSGNPDRYEEFLEDIRTIKRHKEAEIALKELQETKL